MARRLQRSKDRYKSFAHLPSVLEAERVDGFFIYSGPKSFCHSGCAVEVFTETAEHYIMFPKGHLAMCR